MCVNRDSFDKYENLQVLDMGQLSEAVVGVSEPPSICVYRCRTKELPRRKDLSQYVHTYFSELSSSLSWKP